MNKPLVPQDAERQLSVSEFAPRRTGEPYITAAMIAPAGQLGDASRLATMAGPALDQIGTTAADKINLNALTIVENTRRGAETIIAEAHAQAAEMTMKAEVLAEEMRALAKGIQTYTDRKTQQVSEFSNVIQSVLGTMHSLGEQFKSVISVEAETVAKEEEISIPDFLSRKGK